MRFHIICNNFNFIQATAVIYSENIFHEANLNSQFKFRNISGKTTEKKREM